MRKIAPDCVKPGWGPDEQAAQRPAPARDMPFSGSLWSQIDIRLLTSLGLGLAEVLRCQPDCKSHDDVFKGVCL